MDPAIAQQLYHYVKTPHDYKKLRVVNKAMAHYIPPQGKLKLKDYFCTDDFCKMEMYINQTRNPRWSKLDEHLQSFRYLTHNTSDGWYKHHWAMYHAFNAYIFYKNKSNFDAIEKAFDICWDTDNGDIAVAAYDRLRSKNIISLKDYYNFITKYFSLGVLECIGY